MENNIKALNELSKGAHMGLDAVKFILDIAKDEGLRSFLKTNQEKYQNLIEKIDKVYSKYRSEEPQKTNTMNKVMTWYTLKLKTITDHTTSKLAEILFQGFNMGISEGRKLLNHKEVDRSVNELIEEYVTLQEESTKRVKKFL